MPENHKCSEIWRAKAPQEAASSATVESEAPYEYRITFGPLQPTKTFWFSPTEIRHLAISALLVTAVGISLVVFKSSNVEILIGSALVFVSVFLLHEIAHKFMAQHYGLWAEFRLTMTGALLTLISIISPLKIISPGAVMISGHADKEIVGKTSIVGPVTNLVLALISLAIYQVPSLPPSISTIVLLSIAFNAWIAFFNILPIGILDGLKVFAWNKIIWALVFVPSLILTILTFLWLPF